MSIATVGTVITAKRSLGGAASLSYIIATALTIAAAGLRIRVHACISRSEIANYTAGTITWNGVALTKIPNETTGGSGEWCVGWELRNPTPGTGNLTITNSTNTNDGTFWVIVESGTDNSAAAVGYAFENATATAGTPAATVVAGASAIVCGSSFTFGAATPGALVGTLIGGFEVFRYAAQAVGAVPSLGNWATANQVGAFTSVVQAAAVAPVITGPSGAAGASSIIHSGAENSTAIGTWTATNSGTWSISGGADAAKVQISVGGVVTFIAAKNFEAPDDVGGDGVYNFTVQNVGSGGTVTQDVAYTLTNVTELPGAPTIGTATAGNATVTVPFTPPSAGSAPAVIDYTVTMSPGGATKVVSASPATFTSADGVVNGTAYTGSVTARNSDGTGSASAASNAVTPTFTGPVLSAGTKDAPTATTAVMGFTTTGSDGTARAVWIQSATVPTAPSIAQVKAGQNAAGNGTGVVVPTALTITSAGIKNFASVAVTSGLTYYGFVVHTNAANVDSAVLPLGAVYPGTGRPVADITTTGWSGSAGGLLADLLNEDTANDANFVTSPVLTTTPTALTMSLNKAYPAGTYSGLKAKLWTSTGTGIARIRFLDSSGASVGVSADQAINSTPTLYTFPAVTLTGTAARVVIEGNV